MQNNIDEIVEINRDTSPSTRQNNVGHVLDILRELTPEEAYIFDKDGGMSDISELSDPFEEMAEYKPKTKPKQEVKKDDKGMSFKQTLSGYPPEVSKLYEDVYQKLKENPTAIIVDTKSNPDEFDGFKRNPEFMRKCQNMIDSVGFDHYLMEKKREEERLRKKKVGRKSPPIEFDIETTSFPSMWRQIEAEAKHGVFEITQPGYNRYENVGLDWIKRDKIPDDNMECARVKCEKWLKIKK